MPILRLKDQTGGMLIVNNGAGPWTHIAQAADPQTKKPLLGFSAMFFGTDATKQLGVMIKGSPDEIAGMIEEQEASELAQ